MSRILLGRLFLIVVGLATTTASVAQEPLDGPKRIFHDQMIENLAGQWKMLGSVMGRPVEYVLKAEWVLNHQFLRLHMSSTGYEAMVFIGYDNTSERYVAHWIDVFGGRASETLGFGKRQDNSIKFVFEYPDGPFHNTFEWRAATKSWRFLLEQKDKSGKWMVFADYDVRRT